MIVNLKDVPQGIAVQQISALEQELFNKGAWSTNAITEEFNAPARTYYLDIDPITSREQPTIRGYAGYWFDGYDAQIMTIGVGKQWQQQGIATELLQHIITSARAQQAERVLLEVRVDNAPAITLYEHHGFERMGIRKRYYQPEGIDAYTMSLPLKPRIIGFQPNNN